jgi:hypothetical protein
VSDEQPPIDPGALDPDHPYIVALTLGFEGEEAPHVEHFEGDEQ